MGVPRCWLGLVRSPKGIRSRATSTFLLLPSMRHTRPAKNTCPDLLISGFFTDTNIAITPVDRNLDRIRLFCPYNGALLRILELCLKLTESRHHLLLEITHPCPLTNLRLHSPPHSNNTHCSQAKPVEGDHHLHHLTVLPTTTCPQLTEQYQKCHTSPPSLPLQNRATRPSVASMSKTGTRKTTPTSPAFSGTTTKSKHGRFRTGSVGAHPRRRTSGTITASRGPE